MGRSVGRVVRHAASGIGWLALTESGCSGQFLLDNSSTSAPHPAAWSTLPLTGSTPDPTCGTLRSARAIASPFHESTTLLEVTSDGGLAVVGYFRQTLVFDPGGPAEVTLYAYGSDNDAFVARYDASGTFLWVRQFGAASVTGAAATSDGGLALTGWYRGTARFALGGPDEVALTSAGETDGFVARLDPDGGLSWLEAISGASFDLPAGVAVVDDDALVVGRYDADTTLGQTTLPLAPSADSRGFVARYAGATGDLAWAESFGGTEAASADAAAFDPVSGELVLLGSLAGSGVAEFPGVVPIEVDPSGRSGFLARWDPAGGARSVVPVEGFPVALDVGPDGRAVVGGVFTEDAVFGPGEASETTLSTVASAEAFAAAWAADGTLLWAAQSSSSPNGTTAGNGIAATADGGAVLSGESADATFGPSTLAGHGAFLARFGPTGGAVCAAAITSHSIVGRDVVELPDGSFAATGEFDEAAATFAPGTPTEVELPNAGAGDGYVGVWSF